MQQNNRNESHYFGSAGSNGNASTPNQPHGYPPVRGSLGDVNQSFFYPNSNSHVHHHNQIMGDDMSVEWHSLFDASAHNTASNNNEWGSMGGDLSVAPSAIAEESFDPKDMKKKISDAQTYGPRFCSIFETYCQKHRIPIDIRRHLMSLCLEHLVPFIKWARESETQVQWIHSMLLENDYLRPEVRNGVVMVLIYTFAAMKATVDSNLDMFITLQDGEQGMGIANKFSLKIYNDPFFYLIFLKVSISALIDAGVLPDNERQNQPKRSKISFQNREEFQSFQRLQKMIIDNFDSGNIAAAKSIVNTVANFWQQRGKFIRNRRFSAAVVAVTNPRSLGIVEINPMGLPWNDSIPHNSVALLPPAPITTAPPLATSVSSVELNDATNSVTSVDKTKKTGIPDEQDSALPRVQSGSLIVERDLLVPATTTMKENVAGTKRSSSALQQEPQLQSSDDEDDLNNNRMFISEKHSDDSTYSEAKRRNMGTLPSISQVSVAPPLSSSVAHPSSTYTKSNGSYHHYQPQNNTLIMPSPMSARSGIISSPVSRALSSWSIPTMRFERIAWNRWELKEMRVYDIQSFLRSALRQQDYYFQHMGKSSSFHQAAENSHSHPVSLGTPVTLGSICLVTEVSIAEEMRTKELSHNMSHSKRFNAIHSLGTVSVLEQELNRRHALLASWTAEEVPQLLAFLRAYQQYCRFSMEQQLQERAQNLMKSFKQPPLLNKELHKSDIRLEDDDENELRNEEDRANDPENSHIHSSSDSKTVDTVTIPTLYDFWMTQSTAPKATNALHNKDKDVHSSNQKIFGYLAYEVPVQIALLVRAESRLSLSQDLWCTLYPSDITEPTSDLSFGDFLTEFFPQLLCLSSKIHKKDFPLGGREITIRYFAHSVVTSTHLQDNSSALPDSDGKQHSKPGDNQLPKQLSLSNYQTIGTWAQPAIRVLSRLSPGPVIHDFIFEVIE